MEKKRNIIYSEVIEDNKFSRTTRQLFVEKRVVKILKYSDKNKGKKKSGHSIFFNSHDLLRDIPSNIWDERWEDIEISYREDNEKMIKPFEGNLQDTEMFLKARLEEQRIAKKVISTRRKKNKILNNPIRVLNEKITKSLIMRKQGFNLNYISKSLGLKDIFTIY